MGVKCFFIEPAGKLRRKLRRYVGDSHGQCPAMPGPDGYHDARAPFDVIDDPDPLGVYGDGDADAVAADDARWPARCACGYEFKEDDARQVFVERVYRRADTGEETDLRDAPPGAMWDAWWMANFAGWCGPDGRSLMVKLPNGNDWHIDGPCNNCTDPEGSLTGAHKCWVRHGEPPVITVDKNGVTCGAGGGSILSGSYHGFLVNGEFQP
jgi:hypothetical protein